MEKSSVAHDFHPTSLREYDIRGLVGDTLTGADARAIGRSGGVIGARMTGGGFGGSTVTLCESRNAVEIAATLSAEYQKATGIKPQIFASRPSQGAHLVG